MATRLIIDGNAVYEIDEECMEGRNKNKTAGAQQRMGKRRKAEADTAPKTNTGENKPDACPHRSGD